MNVLFIMVDDLRPELGCYGASHIQSPNLDKLAAGGTVFERAYVQQAVCSPSRTSLLTGLRPDQTRIYDLETHFRSTVPSVTTLPQLFRQNGYETTAYGKIFHGGLDDTLSWSKPSDYVSVPHRSYQLLANVELDRREGKRGPAYESAAAADEAYQDGKIAQAGIKQLRAWRDKPFFLALGFIKPHLPFVAPQKYWNLYDSTQINIPTLRDYPKAAPKQALSWAEIGFYEGMPTQYPMPDAEARRLIHGYYACVSFVDAQIGKVLDELARLGLDKNTLVVVIGDHGWKLGDYGHWCKHSNFEYDTRAPMIVRMPKQANPQTISALVEFTDLYPTLAEAAGIEPPAHLQGQSLLPFLQGKRQSWKKPALSQYPRQGMMGYALRTDRFRLVRWQDRNNPGKIIDVELYDHQQDKSESVNVANQAEYKTIVTTLNQQLDAALAKQVRGKYPRTE